MATVIDDSQVHTTAGAGQSCSNSSHPDAPPSCHLGLSAQATSTRQRLPAVDEADNLHIGKIWKQHPSGDEYKPMLIAYLVRETLLQGWTFTDAKSCTMGTGSLAMISTAPDTTH